MLVVAQALLTHAFQKNDERLQRGIRALLDQQYDSAEYHFAQLYAMDSTNFDAAYLRFATRQSKILDYESYALEEKEFLAFADSMVVLLHAQLERLKASDSLRCLFYIGNVYGGKSTVLAKNDKWLSAISSAFTSVSYLKSVVRKNPDFLAAYLGLGIYDYYLSKNLQWLPFLEDRRTQGIREIQLATAAESPFDVGAKNILCWIYIENGDFKRADSIARGVLSQMSSSTVFLRIRAVAAAGKGDWTAAAAVGQRLVDISIRRTPVNWSDVTCGYHVMINSYEKQGATDLACALALKALSLNIPEEGKKISHVISHLKAVEELSQRLRCLRRDK